MKNIVILVACITVVIVSLSLPPLQGEALLMRRQSVRTPVAAAFITRPVLPKTSDHTLIAPLLRDLTAPVPSDLPLPLPTNAWWGGGILEAFPAPLFAWPLSGTVAPRGLSIDAPARVVTSQAIMHQDSAPLLLNLDGRSLSQAHVLSFGDWDVTFRALGDDGQGAFDFTMAEGVPFALVRPLRTHLAVDLAPGSLTQTVSCGRQCGSALTARSGARTYLLTVSPGTQMNVRGTRIDFTFGSSPLLSIAVVAPGAAPEAYLPYALHQFAGTRVSFDVSDHTVQTRFTFRESILFTVFPHQQPFLKSAPSSRLGTYETVRGTLHLYSGTSFVTSVPRPAVLPTLPPSSTFSSSSTRAQLQQDIRAQSVADGDVYGAGKVMLRIAVLAELADASGDQALRSEILGKLQSSLSDWCTASLGEASHLLAYDDRLGGLIPIPPAFGSEHYNDHHFHAGYFLHAGAILARLDPQFLVNYGDCMRLLIRDVASFDRSDPSFPFLRSFDPMSGHSWANGLTRFDDGNNQESTSEAMQAWHAIALLGHLMQDTAMENLGVWLLSQEAAGTRAYWFNAFSSAPTLPTKFTHPMISILWGGKADYATFFDASPAAIHGIQFFPATTSLLPVVDHAIIQKLVAPLAANTSDTPWRNELALVTSLDPDASPALLNGSAFDYVYTRSAVDHWRSTLSELGGFDPQWTTPCEGAVFRKGGRSTAVLFRLASDPTSCAFRSRSSGKIVTLTGLGVGWNVRGM